MGFCKLKQTNGSKGYKEKYISKYQFSYAKRKSPVHCEIVDITKPSKTIICAYDHQPRLYVPLKTSKGYFIRPFTVNELQQIQGFPRDYKLSGNHKDKVVQIGNAIPPKLVQNIIEKIKF